MHGAPSRWHSPGCLHADHTLSEPGTNSAFGLWPHSLSCRIVGDPWLTGCTPVLNLGRGKIRPSYICFQVAREIWIMMYECNTPTVIQFAGHNTSLFELWEQVWVWDENPPFVNGETGHEWSIYVWSASSPVGILDICAVIPLHLVIYSQKKKKKKPDMTYIQYITTYTISTSINILDSLLHKPKKTAQVTWGLYYTTKTEKIWMTKFHTATLKILHSLLKSEKVTLVQKLVQVAYNQENSICAMYMLIQPQKHKHQSQVSSSHITTQKEASIYS